MIAAASESGEACVSEAQIFEPAETRLDRRLCAHDAFDPEWADEDGNYAGHYQLAVIRAGLPPPRRWPNWWAR
jgi:hypothetical protein